MAGGGVYGLILAQLLLLGNHIRRKIIVLLIETIIINIERESRIWFKKTTKDCLSFDKSYFFDFLFKKMKIKMKMKLGQTRPIFLKKPNKPTPPVSIITIIVCSDFLFLSLKNQIQV